MSIADELSAVLDQRPRVLILDIETSPNVVHTWGLFNQNVGLSQVKEWGQVISFAAGWDDEDKIDFYSDYHDGHEAMVNAVWRLVNEADIIVHYNGTSFDMKHLNREFLLAELPPPSPHKDIDLMRVVKQRFKFASNKLDNISQQLGVGAKVSHTGFDLWNDCLNGSDEKKEAAWKLMKKYNKGDVKITKEVYFKIKPWIHNHPAITPSDEELLCNKCGSSDLVRDGSYTTHTLVYPRYRCGGCGGWVKGNKSLRRASSVTGVK